MASEVEMVRRLRRATPACCPRAQLTVLATTITVAAAVAVFTTTAASAAEHPSSTTPHTPLYAAAQRGDAAEVQRLLASTRTDGSRDASSPHGLTPLHAAAREGHLDVVRVLLDAGADQNAHGDDANGAPVTPLSLAARGRHKDVVTALLLAGAAVRPASRHGHTVLAHAADYAAEKAGDRRLADYIRDFGQGSVATLAAGVSAACVMWRGCEGRPHGPADAADPSHASAMSSVHTHAQHSPLTTCTWLQETAT